MGLIGSYNLRSMVVRKGTAAMTAGGIAMVVAVFVMTLAIAQGFRATLVASGSPSNAIVLRKGATAESTSGLLRTDVPLIDNLPHNIYAKDANSHFTIVNLPQARMLGTDSPAEAIGKRDACLAEQRVSS